RRDRQCKLRGLTSISSLGLDRIAQRLAGAMAPDLLEHAPRGTLRVGDAGDMGCDDDARMAQQGVFRRRGLLRQDIQNRAVDLPCLQRTEKISLDKVAAATNIEKPGAAGEGSECRGVEDAAGRLRKGEKTNEDLA